MPSPTYVAIAKTVLTGSQASITFSSIPSTYTDLVLLVSARSDRVSPDTSLIFTFNSSSTGYSFTRVYNYAGGGSPGSSSASAASNLSYNSSLVGVDASTTNTFNSVEVYIPNYAGSTNKPISITNVTEGNAVSFIETVQGVAGLFSSSSAISSITIAQVGAFNYVSGSRFDLYGIKNS